MHAWIRYNNRVLTEVPSLNRGFTYTERIGGAAAGTTVLQHLATRYRHSTWEEWLDRIRVKAVRIDGRGVEPDRPLVAGDSLTWERPPWREPEAPVTFAVLHEDRDLLAVAKPAGLPTLPGADFMDNTLLNQVRRYASPAVPAHRLGRFTSGVVVFAKNLEARRALAESWRGGRVRRGYRALASGRPGESSFRIDVPIGPVPYRPLGTLHAATPRGKPAATSVNVLEQRPEGFLGDVAIETGRPHQVRVHLAAAGYPLVGDPLYGPGGVPLPGCTSIPGDPGYFLHSATVELPHPRSGDQIRLWCSPPPRLRFSRGSPLPPAAL